MNEIDKLDVNTFFKSNVNGYTNQTWGKLIVNANALIMHCFLVIHGND